MFDLKAPTNLDDLEQGELNDCDLEESSRSRYGNHPLPREGEPGFLDRYDQSFYGIDIALKAGRTVPEDLIRSLSKILRESCDGHVAIDPFYDPATSTAHILVVSKLAMYQIAAVLTEKDFLFSASPAFLAFEEELSIRTYLYVRLAYPNARTLIIV